MSHISLLPSTCFVKLIRLAATPFASALFSAVAEPFTAKWNAIWGDATSVVQTELSLVRTQKESLDEAIPKMETESQRLLDEIQ